MHYAFILLLHFYADHPIINTALSKQYFICTLEKGGITMNYPEIDSSKLSEVMKIIEAAASLMEEKDCDSDAEAAKELDTLQKQLCEITGNENLCIRDYNAYWSYTSLETVAYSALFQPPAKTGMTDAQITELIQRIYKLDFDVPGKELEAVSEYFLEVLAVETGLHNVSDYIYCPNEIGLDLHADLEEITARILADSKS